MDRALTVDNRNKDIVIEYQQDQIETLRRYVLQLEDELKRYRAAEWRENEHLVGKQR